MHKKILIAILLLAAAFTLIGCSGNGETDAEENILRVVATSFPQFDFVRQIAGNRVDVTMLLSPGTESHSFEPTPRDMIAIYQADLFVYTCQNAENWVAPILNSLGREALHTLALIDLVTPIYAHHDHDHYDHEYHHSHDHQHHDHNHSYDYQHHDHNHSHDHEHHDHNQHHLYDEHVWTSPRNAILIVQAIVNILSHLDPANEYYFRANAATYISELEALDTAFTQVVANGVRTTIIFGDRFPFIYMTEAYGLTAYAAFPGCSTETQASPATIAYLIEKVQHDNIPVIFTIELSVGHIANVIAEATGAEILELHSAHNVSHADFVAGITYLEIMRRNIEHLRRALS